MHTIYFSEPACRRRSELQALQSEPADIHVPDQQHVAHTCLTSKQEVRACFPIGWGWGQVAAGVIPFG